MNMKTGLNLKPYPAYEEIGGSLRKCSSPAIAWFFIILAFAFPFFSCSHNPSGNNGILPDTLTLNKSGNADGKVMVNGSEHVLPYTEAFALNAGVVLEAVASNSSEFSGWSGDLSGKDNPQTVVMDGNKKVTADFSFKMNFNIVMETNRSSVDSFLNVENGGPGSKLVFVRKLNGNNELCFIDFLEIQDTPKVHTISAAQGACVPVISPDGKWVVYAVGPGAEAGSPEANPSSAYLCRLEENATPVLIKPDSAHEPRFLQHSSQNRLTVIYPTLSPNYAWQGHGKTMKVDIDVSGSIPEIGTPQVLYDKGGLTGGLSRDSTYMCGGGGTVFMANILTGDTATVTEYPQACNASISESGIFTNAMMYLTTSVASNNLSYINEGKPWGQWEVILINSMQKQVLKGFTYPKTYLYPLDMPPGSLTGTKWHHPEWSNHPYFAVATVNTDRSFANPGGGWFNTYYQERIFMINLKDSTYLEVLRPDTIRYSGIDNDDSGFYWPWLWVEIPAGFTEDPNWLMRN